MVPSTTLLSLLQSPVFLCLLIGIIWGTLLGMTCGGTWHHAKRVGQHPRCWSLVCCQRHCSNVNVTSVHAGGTNPLLRRGTLVVEKKRRCGSQRPTVLLHLFTWQYSVFQVLNLLGSVLFALALRGSDLSLAVPLANGTSILTNAVVDYLLGEGVSLWPGVPGVAFLTAGVVLCASG